MNRRLVRNRRFAQCVISMWNYLSPTVMNFTTPFTRYNRLSNRLDNRFDNRLDVCLHDAVGCPTGCTTEQSVVQPV